MKIGIILGSTRKVSKSNVISEWILDKSKNEEDVYKTIISFCKNYETLCQKKYPDAPLPLEILKSTN